MDKAKHQQQRPESRPRQGKPSPEPQSEAIAKIIGHAPDEPVSFLKKLSAAHPTIQQPAETESSETRGKSRHPDYVRIGVVLHKDTKKIASRLWEDAEPKKDLSDLIEVLLRRYIAEQRQQRPQ